MGKRKESEMKKMILVVTLAMAMFLFSNLNPVLASEDLVAGDVTVHQGSSDGRGPWINIYKEGSGLIYSGEEREWQSYPAISESGRFVSWTEVTYYKIDGSIVLILYEIHLFDTEKLDEYVPAANEKNLFDTYSSAVNDNGDIFWVEVHYSESGSEDVFTVKWWNVFSGGDDNLLYQNFNVNPWINGMRASNSWIVVEVKENYSCNSYGECQTMSSLEVFSAESKEDYCSLEFWNLVDYAIEGDSLIIERRVSSAGEEPEFRTERYNLGEERHDGHSGGCFISTLL